MKTLSKNIMALLQNCGGPWAGIWVKSTALLVPQFQPRLRLQPVRVRPNNGPVNGPANHYFF
jgi:hypothetical protein